MISCKACTVPEAPIQLSKPTAKYSAAYGAKTALAPSIAWAYACGEIMPSAKYPFSQVTHPMEVLCSTLISGPTPIINSVLAPPISITKVRPV